MAMPTGAVTGVVAPVAVGWFVLAATRSVAWRETLHGGAQIQCLRNMRVSSNEVILDDLR